MAILRFDDKALVKRMLAGQEEAFEEFFESYFPALYRFALTRLNQNEDLAEEIVQATLDQGDPQTLHLPRRSGSFHLALHLLPL